MSDDESVASYTEESDDDFEPDEYTQLSDSETDSETDSESDSESEADSDVNDDDFFVCYNPDLVKALMNSPIEKKTNTRNGRSDTPLT